MPSKLQMKRIGPWKILEKYGPNTYKVDLPKDMSISPIFNVKYLIQYKGPKVHEAECQEELGKDILDMQVPKKKQPQVERILDFRVRKSTRKKVYKEHLVKWLDKPEVEVDFKRYGISMEFISPRVP